MLSLTAPCPNSDLHPSYCSENELYMKVFLLLAGIATLTLVSWQLNTSAPKTEAAKDVQTVAGAGFQPVAVLELFTSQGCSSCPPADALLARTLEKAADSGQQVFGLSFHVDYWNRLGWADPFSSAAFTERQQRYARSLGSSLYTPQLVINGVAHVVGSNRTGIHQAVNQALMQEATVRFTRLEVQKEGAVWKLSYAAEGDLSNMDIQIALVSLKVTTAVQRGENVGRSLTHVHVVRQFLSQKAESSATVTLTLPPQEDPDKLGLLVYAQHRQTLRIHGAAHAGS
jgi:hypothetical protein